MICFDPIPDMRPMSVDIKKVLLRSLNVLYDYEDDAELQTAEAKEIQK